MAKLILNFIAAVEFGHANVNAEKLEVLRVLLSSHLFSKKPVIRKACLPVIITEVQLHLSKSNDELREWTKEEVFSLTCFSLADPGSAWRF